MTHDETTAEPDESSVTDDGVGSESPKGVTPAHTDSVTLDDSKSSSKRCSSDDSSCANDRVSQIDEDNGLADPSLASSCDSSSSSHVACGSTSSFTPSDTNHCKRPSAGNSVSDVDAELVITDCISSEKRGSSAGQGDPRIASCYNPALDDEIRNRLDRLNSLSDLINSLELQFDQANLLFRETLRCSTERLSIIAKTLGSKSIRHGRNYHAAKISVEQSQSDCQRACVQFEKANHNHQLAKEAIQRAEIRLKQMNSGSHDITTVVKNMAPVVIPAPTGVPDDGQPSSQAVVNTSFEFSDLCRLKLEDGETEKSNNSEYSRNDCDRNNEPNDIQSHVNCQKGALKLSSEDLAGTETPDNRRAQSPVDSGYNHEVKIEKDTELSEELNQAILRLIEAEQKRRESEKAHLDQANKLMFAQENLLKLEREHGNSIRRSQVYFDEARRFNAKLDSVKSDIARISGEIIAAKKSYAGTLNELEQFSEDLHISSSKGLVNSRSDKE